MVKRKMSARVTALILVFIVSISFVNAATVKTLYTWTYNNKLLSINYSFDQSAYNYYKGQQRVYSDFLHYMEESAYYPVIKTFAEEFRLIASENKYSDWQTVECIISFIQTLRYKNDGTYEYPRYPIETLIDKGGDCEDTAILLAALLQELGFDVVLVSPDKHMGVGIALKYEINGAAFEHRNKYYYYIETTSGGWAIGDYPEHLSAEVAIYDPGTKGPVTALSEYVYSFKNYAVDETEDVEVAANEPPEQDIDPAYEFNSSSLDSDIEKPENKYTIDVDNIIINGEKETMVTEKVSGENGEKIIATSK